MCFWFLRKKKKVEETVKVEKEAEVSDDTEVIEEDNKTTILGTKVYHVNKRASDGKWTIKFAHGKKVIKTFDKKDEAMEYANKLADNQGGVVLFHASRGANKGKIVKQGWDAFNAKKEKEASKELEKEPEVVEEVNDTEVIEENNKSNKPATKVYHVNKRAEDGKWTIKFAHGKKVIKTFDKKDEAMEYAKALAESQDGVVLFHASKGANKGKIVKQGWDAYKGKENTQEEE